MHWDRFYFEYFGLALVSIILPTLHTHSSVTDVMILVFDSVTSKWQRRCPHTFLARPSRWSVK